MTQFELIREAAAIVDGKSAKPSTMAHVEALVGLLRLVADRWPENKAMPMLPPTDMPMDMLDIDSAGYERAVAGMSFTIRAALEGRT